MVSFNTRKQNILFGAGVVLAFFCCFFLGHVDSQWIVSWGYDLLNSIFVEKNLAGFPSYTYQHCSMPTNYSLFTNCITALWISPLYLLEHIVKLRFGIGAFVLYYKVLVFLAFVFSLKLCSGILETKVGEKEQSKAMLYYMFSSVLWLGVLAKGQVDIFVLVFVLLGMREFLRQRDSSRKYLKSETEDQKYYEQKKHGEKQDRQINGSQGYAVMSIYFGLAVLVKPIVLLAIIPCLLLLIGKKGWSVIFYGVLLAIPSAIDRSITAIVMPCYQKFSDLTNQMYKDTFGKSRIEEIFSVRIGAFTVMIGITLIVCFICYYKGVHNTVKKEDYLIYPTVLMASFAVFVSPTVYWYVVILPLLIMMGCLLKNQLDHLLLQLGISVSAIGIILFGETQYIPTLRRGILGILEVGTGAKYLEQISALGKFLEGISEEKLMVLLRTSRTGFGVCMLLLIAVFIYERQLVPTTERKGKNPLEHNPDMNVIQEEKHE